MRRALRIFPLYYAVLFALFILFPLVKHLSGADADILHHQGWFWLYGSNLLIAWRSAWPSAHATWLHVDHFWSLAVEEHFYLVWPTVILLLSRKAAIRFCAFCIVAALALRVVLYVHYHHAVDSWIPGYVLTPCRMDALALGGLIALLARGPGGVRALLPAARLLFLTCGLYTLYIILKNPASEGFSMMTISYTLIALCFGGLLLLAVAAPPASVGGRFFSLAPLRLLGKYSYGIYLFHEACRPFFDKVVTVEKLRPYLHSYLLAVAAYIVIASAASFGIAFLSWQLFEKHFLKLKRFFAYSD
jgi:peptidoglycan/LPS O-acetylase OafA/YrhL